MRKKRSFLHQCLFDNSEQVANGKGKNLIPPPEREPLWKAYMEKFKDPLIMVLLVVFCFSIVVALYEAFYMGQGTKILLEPLGILSALLLATGVGFIFEVKAEREFEVLNTVKDRRPIKVYRRFMEDGKEKIRIREVRKRDVCVGDYVYLENGDEIPADGRLDETNAFIVDESNFTGEPYARKSAYEAEFEQEATFPPNMVLRGSTVIGGTAIYHVEQIGMDTVEGKGVAKTQEGSEVETPLNQQLDSLGRMISKLSFIVAALIVVGRMVYFFFFDGNAANNHSWLEIAEFALGSVMLAVTLVVVAVPEGLPMSVTVSLALSMRRMLKEKNLVRKLHACETMGATTVICTDKTGTLTQNKMRVDHITPANPSDPNSELLLNVAMAVNSTAELDGENVVGNPTEGALLLWLRDHDKHYATLRQQYKVVSQQPFSTEKKYMLTTVDMGDKTMTFVKGAPEIVLNMCTPDAPERQRAEEVLAHYQQQAMRTLAFAYATGDEPFTLQGVVAISDPVRPDVPPAVAECQRAGIQVKVVTGDTSATAIEIARQIGVWPAHGEREEATWHITGTEWASLSDEEAFKRCMALRVMSRARPTDKQRLVEMLQRHGEVVAVTGDGTNDAPALNHAHVGLSLGSGTSVAKQASDITLLDDSFHAIANAVMWGRSLYKNIQRFLYFQLVVNLSALLLVLGGSIIGTEMPLTVTQILWVNLIMDTFAAMALASLPPSHEVMRNKPRRDTDFIISRPMARGILFCGMVFFLGMFMFLIWCERHGAGSVVDVHELTLFFTTFVMLQFWNLFNAKSLGSDYSAFRYFWRDGGLVLVLALVFIGQWIIVTFGGKMFRTLPLSFEEWGAITVGTSVVLWAGELWRAWKRWCNRKFSVLKP